jgi:hypothetical protein
LLAASTELQTSLWSRPFVEDCAHSLTIEPQPEAVFLRKLRDLCLSIFLVKWPEARQFTLVNNTMLPFANVQFAVDLARKCLHAAAQMFGTRVGRNWAFPTFKTTREWFVFPFLTSSYGKDGTKFSKKLSLSLSSPARRSNSENRTIGELLF